MFTDVKQSAPRGSSGLLCPFELQLHATRSDIIADSRRIFQETMALIRDALDPEFEDVSMIDHIKVVIDDQPDKELDTG